MKNFILWACIMGMAAGCGNQDTADQDALSDVIQLDDVPEAEAKADPDGPGDPQVELKPDLAAEEQVEAIDSGADQTIEDIEEEEEAGELPACPATRPLPLYSGGTCPVITGGPTKDTSVVSDFYSAGDRRDFRFLVPENYDGTEEWPLVFAWHWLNASSSSFVREGELETAASEMKMLIVIPDLLEKDNGDKEYLFDWPFDPFSSDTAREKELTFFDDLLTCVSRQYRVDRCRVYAIGVSAGALWLTYLSTTERVNSLASIQSLSGGLAEISLWVMEYQPQPNKFPAIVLWGGPLDIFPPINFQAASIRYRDALIADNHFVVTCTHSSGHAVPPIEPPPGKNTKFWSLWQFFFDHPYGLPAGWSPYQTTGLPEGFPEWCRIATP